MIAKDSYSHHINVTMVDLMTHPTLTDRAAQRIHKVMEGEKPGSMLRISVDGGGCSGFQYVFDIESSKQDDDILIEQNGAKVLIDEVSLGFLKNAVIDFVDDLMGQSFQIQNPQAKSSCGCGVSFTI